MGSAPPRTPWSAYPGLLLVAAATLLLEICLTRVLSVALWYHFAFMVVSTALFGLGFAGVALALRRSASEVPSRLVALCALATPVAFVLGYGLFNLVPFEPFSLGVDAVQWLYLPLSYLAVTLPFFFSGLTIAALLTRHARSVHRLYMFDLLGAGLGSLGVVFLLPRFGGSGTVLASAVLAAIGAALLARETSARLSKLAVGLAVALAALVPFGDDLIPVRISSNKVVGSGRTVADVLADPEFHRYTTWNTTSRVDVIEYRDARGSVHRNVLIDAGTAMTRLAHPLAEVDSLGPTADEESWFVRLFDAPRVLVVGSGGGREVLLALRNSAAKVTAVEINPAINHLVADLMADFTGHLYQHPKVEVVCDEARSFIRRTPERFEVIHCPHTISNAAMSSGSLSLAENHLLTIEAFGDYLDHLAGDGVLVITRPEAHLPRLFTTARALFELENRPGIERSVLAWRARSDGLAFYAGFALRARPFSAAEIADLAGLLERRQLEALYLPGLAGRAPYRDLLTASDPMAVPVPFAAILEPATDDRPFFNQRVPLDEIGWSDLLGVFSRGRDGRMALEDRPVAESALLALLLQAAVVALLLIVAPLWVFRRRALSGAGRLRTLSAFACLGLAYIVVEVGMIQRFSLYLGRPVVVFSTVLGALLVASGLGSAFARRFRGARAPLAAAAGAGGAALVTALVAPWMVDATLYWPAAARVIFAMVMLAPVGFVMGMPFPLLVRRLDATHPERIPWAWGVNGFASVVGSIGAVLLGMTVGYTAVLLCGVACYALAALSTLGSTALAQVECVK